MSIYRIPDDLEELKKRILGGKSFDRIMDLFRREGGNLVVLEEKYFDEEYYSEYRCFYSSLFQDYPPYTSRLHFLKEKKAKKTVDYLGYCVIRPTESNKICETMLFPPSEESKFPLTFVLCVAEYPVEFREERVSILAAPFIEPDGNVGVCAQAAIWMVSRYMSRRFGTRHYTLNEITERANRYITLGRPIPSPGLDSRQILQALGLMGYSPLMYNFRRPQPPIFTVSNVTYKYVESELPVLCQTEDHIFPIIGHTFDEKAEIKEPLSEEFAVHRSVEWIDNFICHNGWDHKTFGPYVSISKKELDDEIDQIYVPIPFDVNIKGEEVESWAFKLLKEIKKNLMKTRHQEVVIKAYQQIGLEEGKCVLRTYLIESQRYKKLMKDSQLSSFVKKRYLDLPMPKFIWIVEISNIDIFPKERKMLGEIIFDSTAPGFLQSLAFLAFHIPGILGLKNPKTRGISTFIFSPDTAYEHFIRRVFSPPRTLRRNLVE